MSEVLVRNLDEAVVDQLKARARGNGRSLQAELKLILEQAAQPTSAQLSRSAYRALADQVRATLGDRPQSDSPRCWPMTGRGEHHGRIARDPAGLARTAIADAGLSRARAYWPPQAGPLGTRVTDLGLMHLRGLSGLRELDVERTQVSEGGVEGLRRALPGLEIVH